MLEVAFGRHVIEGDLTKSIVTGSSPTHVVTVQHMLGDARGKGWDGVEGLWFRGTNRPPAKYKFYPGIMSPGNDDTVQGIDSVFDKDTPHSNTAWIRCELPNGSEVGIPDFDTKASPPDGLTGIYRTQLGDIYDEEGEITASDVFLTNPADCIAFGCTEIWRRPISRVDWESLETLRAICDATVTPDYTTLPEGVGLTARYYAGANFDTLVERRIDPVIQFDLSAGAPALGLDPNNFSARYEGKIRGRIDEAHTLYITHNDGVRFYFDGDLVIDQWASTGEHSVSVGLDPDDYIDIVIEWKDESGDAQLKFEWQSASQARQVIPQEWLYPKNEAQKRFECHVAFTQRTTFDDFLRQVLFTCNGGFQDVGGKLSFFCIDELETSFDFTPANIKKGTFSHSARFSQQDLMSLPNRYIADGRDLNSRYLEKFDPELVYDLPDLQEIAGRIITETVFVGNTTRWQALDNLRHYAKLRSSPTTSEFDGTQMTLSVLHGDLVTVSHPNAGWEEKRFLCIEATDKAIEKGADHRFFRLLDWE